MISKSNELRTETTGIYKITGIRYKSTGIISKTIQLGTKTTRTFENY